MKARTFTIAGLALAALLSGGASAQKLDTFAGSIDLPFDFRLVDRKDESANSVLEFSAKQRLRVAIESGPLRGREASVVVGYALPVKGDSANRVHDTLRAPGVRDLRSAPLDRFAFSLYARDEAGPEGAALTSAVMVGSLNNAMLSIALERPASRELDASAAQSVAGFALDFTGILRARARFDEAARGATAGWKMLTPAGDYAVDSLMPRLFSTWTQTGADGRVIASRNAYAFARAGFWGNELMEFASACGVGEGRDALARQSRIEPDSAFSRVAYQGAPMRGRIGKVDATYYDVKLASTRGSGSAGSRWIAVDGDTWYAFDFLSNKGDAFEQDLRAEINRKPLACTPKALLAFGDPMPRGAP